VALFGSRARGDAEEGSDIDLLIEFSDDEMGALEVVRIERELSEQLGVKVDLVEPEALSKYLRGAVLREAQQIYPA
jgi:predicted nucleotidyltransferase